MFNLNIASIFSKKKIQPYVWLLVVLFLAYLPLSTFHFSLKNDAFTDNFPNKWFFSHALLSGNSTIWNPYMNFGLPLYADMGFAYYNPITWLFGAIGYNVYSFTAELLVYLYIAGVGMFNLGRFLGWKTRVALLVGCMYMCSGFFVGHLQHFNFITTACFFPWLMHCLVRLQQQSNFRNTLLLALAGYMCIAGGHPALPIGALYFFGVIVWFLIYASESRLSFFGYLLLSLAVCALLASPMLYAYKEVLPYHVRNQPVSSTDAFGESHFSLASFITLLFPFSGASQQLEWFGNDVAMRNIYCSLIGMIAAYRGFRSNQKWARMLGVAAGVALLIAVGGTVKMWTHWYLPGMNYIRVNGEFRVFIQLSICIMAGWGLQHWLTHTERHHIIAKKFSYVTALAAVIGFYFLLFQGNTSTNINQNLYSSAKQWLSALNFRNGLLISVAVTAGFAIWYAWSFRKNANWLSAIVMADLIVHTCLLTPITGVGRTTLQSIQSYLNNNTKAGIPTPPLTPILSNPIWDSTILKTIGSASYYHQHIGNDTIADYPFYLTATEKFLTSNHAASVLAKPFIHTASNTTVQLTSYTTTHLTVNVNTTKADTLFVLQNLYPGWRASVNGKATKINTFNAAFMAIPIGKGSNSVQLQFNNPTWRLLCWVSLLSALSMLIVIVYKRS